MVKVNVNVDMGNNPEDGELSSILQLIVQQNERLLEMADAMDTKVAQLEGAIQSMQLELAQARERVATKDDVSAATAAELVAIKAAMAADPKSDTTALEGRIQSLIDTINSDSDSLKGIEPASNPQADNPNPTSTEPNPLPGADPESPAPAVTTESGAATSANTVPVDPAATTDTTADSGSTATSG